MGRKSKKGRTSKMEESNTALENRIRQLEERVAALEALDEERRKAQMRINDSNHHLELKDQEEENENVTDYGDGSRSVSCGSFSADETYYDYGFASGQLAMARGELYDDDDDDNDDDDDEEDEDEEDDDYHVDEEGRKLLSLAKKGETQDVKRILNRKYDLIRTKNSDGDTALHGAARFGHAETVKEVVDFILRKKKQGMMEAISIAEPNNAGDTPLHLAIKQGKSNQEVSLYLVMKYPDAAYKPNQDGVSPLLLAIQGKHTVLVKELFKGLRENELSKFLREELLRHDPPILNEAVKAKNTEILSLLLDNLSFLLNSRDKRGWSPLSYAAYKGYKDVVSCVLEKFPKCIEDIDDDGSFPVHKAAMGGHVTILREFASCHQESIYQNTKQRQNILHLAVLAARKNVITYVMKEHAPKFQKMLLSSDEDGKTVTDLLNIDKK